jgi:uncharacterized protein (DUF58 family)
MARSSAYLRPDIIGRLAGIGLRAGLPKEGNIAGLHRSPLHGHSPEFADYRSYTPGDDLKGLDWRVFARSDRFYVKRFEEESNLRALFIVDGSASMRYGEQYTKYDCAATIATSLAAVLLRQRDAVGVAAVSTDVRREMPPSGTASQLAKLVELLESIELSGETDVGSAVSLLADRLPRRGLVVVLSDLLTPLDRLYDALGKLQYSGHEIVLFHVLHRDEVEMPFNDSVIFRDIEGEEELFAEPWSFRTAYQAAMQTFIDTVRERCQYCGIDYVRVLTDEDLGSVLSHFLHTRQQRGPTKHRGRMSALPGDEEPVEAAG